MTAPTEHGSDPGQDPRATAPGGVKATRPFYWSVRRELWENRSIYVGPLVAAAVVLLGFGISTYSLPEKLRSLDTLTPARQHAVVLTPFSMAAVLVILTAYAVGVFYCLDALHGERRDRSILFWKSLPVSDLTTVLAKACVPLVVLPPLIAAISLATQLIMLLVSSLVLAASGVGAAPLWTRLPLFQMSLVMLYGLAVHALWHAPLYAWLLLVSAWARRMPFLWALLPLAVAAIERIAFGTTYWASLLKYRVVGAMTEAFALRGHRGPIDRLALLDPVRFVGSPGLWIGLACAAALLVAAAHLRRRRGPL